MRAGWHRHLGINFNNSKEGHVMIAFFGLGRKRSRKMRKVLKIEIALVEIQEQ